MNLNGNLTACAVLGFASALCLLGLTACSSTTVIKTGEQPALRSGSALKSITPLKVCVQDFQDLRGTEPDLAFAFGQAKWRLDKPVAMWVRDSLRREFERNGHTCLSPERVAEADLVMDGSVYRCSVDVGMGVTGRVGAKISASAARDPAVRFSGKFDGSFYDRANVTSGATVLNEALLNLIKDLTTDPAFLDFLRRAGGAPE